MSTATAFTASPAVSHLPLTPHPIPLREQAFTLHCQGLRSPAISAELGVPERTIRAWIAAALAELKDDLQLSRKEQLLLAVARQHQLTATAWQHFEREAAARDALLDAALQTLLASNNPNSSESANASTRPLHLHLPASTPAPRYLSLILQANKETNRLLGLHTLAKLELLPLDTPEPASLGPEVASSADSPIPAKTATASLSPADLAEASTGRPPGSMPQSHIPAESATGTPPLAAYRELVSDWIPADADSRIAAESATAITDPQNPAKTATAPAAPPPSPAFGPIVRAPAFQGSDLSVPAESATAGAGRLSLTCQGSAGYHPVHRPFS